MTYIEENKLIREQFDLVVLSIGFKPSKNVLDLAKKFNIELDEYGFNKSKPFSPLQTSREGIFACGMFSSPMDIPETVADASGVASQVAALLNPVKFTQIQEKVFEVPEKEIDITEEPRIGVLICHCGINIGKYVDIPQVIEHIKTLPNVVFCEYNLYSCSSDSQARIKEVIKPDKQNYKIYQDLFTVYRRIYMNLKMAMNSGISK